MSTAGQKFMTELSTRTINAAAPSSSGTSGLLPCPFCGGNDLIRGVRYAKYSDTKDDAIRCQACDCNVPLKAWNARHVAQGSVDCGEVEQLRMQVAGTKAGRDFHIDTASELLALLTGIIEAESEFRDSMGKNWEGDPLSDAIDAARRFINLEAPSPVPSTTLGGAATKHSGTFLGYRDEHGNEMHCANAFCPHQDKCRKGCVNPVAVTSTDRGTP